MVAVVAAVLLLLEPEGPLADVLEARLRLLNFLLSWFLALVI